ncbi:M23 family metallopeptidase [Bacillus sp. FJAT-52991]|uniref:M23 family metallopeptidase n=1 Tax=Bacillus kandeliae TaxID=3129297 RepID=A0ABZ2N9P6_9BACI
MPNSSLAATSFTWPADGKLTDTFGSRGGKHYGIDIAKSGTVPIKASASGTVSKSYYSSSYGEVVFIKHNINGVPYETVYAHMKSGSRKVSAGQKVNQGTVIGYMGNTGHSSGQHLHFELHKGTWNSSKSNAVNPLNYLGKETQVEYHKYDGTFATLKVNAPKDKNVNIFGAPGYGLKGSLPNGGTYKVYNKAIGSDGNTYYNIGDNTWIHSANVIVTPYRATVDYQWNVNVYSAPNGAYKGKVSPGTTFKVDGAEDGWYDLGQNTWIKAEYVKVVK